MKTVTDQSEETHDITFYQYLVKKLSKNSKRMLDLIYDQPGISSSSIQRKFRFESRHTLLKYLKQLLSNELVEVQKNNVDRRQKQIELTSKGHFVRKMIIKENMEDCLTCFLENCEKMFLTNNPGYLNSFKWGKFKENGYSDDFIEDLENKVYSYILKELESNH